MKVHFYGATRTVTGSQHLIEANGQLLLLECGVFQGRRAEFYERNCCFQFDPKSLGAVILSHAHIDHSGNLPNLVKQGYRGPIYATPPTVELADIMLQDSGHIYEEDASFINLKRRKAGEPYVEPLYTKEDARKVSRQFHAMEYEEQFEPIRGVKARLVNAGHILGSAAVTLEIEENGDKKRLWFSGDIGRYKLPLLPDPVLPTNADIVIMECTYGDTKHDDPEEAYQEFRDVVLRTIQRRGKVVVPAFAVGRTQEMVYSLNRMISDGELPRIPVFVDSPLAVHASDIFRKYPDYFDDETHQFVQTGKHPALTFDGLTYTHSVEESKHINRMTQPMVIISASGMAEAGRILHHLAHTVENERNTVAIVSWQAPNTLGRRIAEKQPEIRIFNQTFTLRAEVANVHGFSAHAGQDLLLRYALTAHQHNAKQFYLVHGDPEPADALQQLMRNHGIQNITYPELGEVVEL